MWTNLAKRATSRKFKLPSEPFSLSSSSLGCSPHTNIPEKVRPHETQTRINSSYPVLGSFQVGVFFSKNELGNLSFCPSEDPFGFYSSLKLARGYASVAEAIESTDTEEDFTGSDEIQDLLEIMKKNAKAQPHLDQPKNIATGTETHKYQGLRRRQIKMETEAWEEAAKEYQELLADMCEQKLAPNLPYMKSLFLGWFEPFRNAIAADQEVSKGNKNKLSHAPYFNELPAEMMAVITMHKLMGLLMTNSSGVGCTRLIHAASQIGEAIEHEV